MTINNVSFGPSSDPSSITGAIKEYIPKKFALLFNVNSKAISSGAIKQVDTKGVDWTCTVVPPCTSDVGWGRDFSRWPVGTAVAPVKMRVPPTQILGKVSLGLAAANVQLSVSEQAEYVESQVTARLKQMSMQLARGIFGGTASPVATGLGAWSSTAANGTLVASFTDISLFKENAAYDMVKASNGLAYTVRVQSILRTAVSPNSANVAGTITFINDVPNPNGGAVVALDTTVAAVGDVFRPRGSTAGFGGAATLTGDLLVSMDDLAGTGTVQGQTSATLPGWTGHTQAAGASYSQELISALAGRIEAVSGEQPSHYFCSPQLLRAHGASFQVIGAAFGNSAGLNSGSTPRGVSSTADKYGDNFNYTCNGKPLIADIMCQAGTMVAHQQDHVMLAKYSDIAALEQGGTPKFLDQVFVANNFFLNGQFQLVTDMRCSMGTLTGVTGL